MTQLYGWHQSEVSIFHLSAVFLLRTTAEKSFKRLPGTGSCGFTFFISLKERGSVQYRRQLDIGSRDSAIWRLTDGISIFLKNNILPSY